MVGYGTAQYGRVGVWRTLVVILGYIEKMAHLRKVNAASDYLHISYLLLKTLSKS